MVQWETDVIVSRCDLGVFAPCGKFILLFFQPTVQQHVSTEVKQLEYSRWYVSGVEPNFTHFTVAQNLICTVT